MTKSPWQSGLLSESGELYRSGKMTANDYALLLEREGFSPAEIASELLVQGPSVPTPYHARHLKIVTDILRLLKEETSQTMKERGVVAARVEMIAVVRRINEVAAATWQPDKYLMDNPPLEEQVLFALIASGPAGSQVEWALNAYRKIFGEAPDPTLVDMMMA
jgi:hypothetical protein